MKILKLKLEPFGLKNAESYGLGILNATNVHANEHPALMVNPELFYLTDECFCNESVKNSLLNSNQLTWT